MSEAQRADYQFLKQTFGFYRSLEIDNSTSHMLGFEIFVRFSPNRAVLRRFSTTALKEVCLLKAFTSVLHLGK
jgi:hypothetical protein